ncbi:hypothetical protein [Streptomyces buecherae]|uniref:hypothetical protein n=2 Tax=Streptomyces TaxID=1883 RepID=UPI001C2760E8|nr:hypothetical protein [Streptomyces buecherae]
MAGESTAGALAPLNTGLAEDKRALAQTLRELFACLDFSIRRYAIHRHLDKGTVSRYLNGGRTPPWSFIANLMADLADEGKPVTAEVEQLLRELHGRSRRAGSAASEVQRLQDRLADADEEASQGKALARALTEVLRDRERRLATLQRKINRLEEERAEDRHAYGQALIAWRGTYQELREERDRLLREVDDLQGALADAKREVSEAEEQCTQLEGQLAEAEKRAGEAGERPGLLEILETTDRTASVPQLVDLVTHLSVPGRTAMATELVKSAGQSRPVEEAATLIEALYGAGHHRQAEAALPALVLVRPAADAAVFIRHFGGEGLEAATATVMKTSLEIHSMSDIAHVALHLVRFGQAASARVYLGAATTVKPVTDVVDLVVLLDGVGARQTVEAALEVCARERSVQEVAELCELLAVGPSREAAACLERVAAETRPARDVVDLAVMVSRFARSGADRLLWHSVNHRRHEHGHLVALVTALHTASLQERASWLLSHAVGDWSVSEVGRLVGALYAAGHWQHAVDVLTQALRAHGADEAASLIAVVDDVLEGGAWTILSEACVVQTPEELAVLIARLGACGARGHASRVFWKGLRSHFAGHAVHLVRSMRRGGSELLAPDALRDYAQRATAGDVVELACALEAAGHREDARSLLAQAGSGSRAQFLSLLAYLASRDRRLAELLVRDVALGAPVPERVRLAVALAASSAETAAYEQCLLDALRQGDAGELAEFTRLRKAARKKRKKALDQVARDGLRRERRQRQREFVRKIPGLAGRGANEATEAEVATNGW